MVHSEQRYFSYTLLERTNSRRHVADYSTLKRMIEICFGIFWYVQYLPDRTRSADGQTGGGAHLATKRAETEELIHSSQKKCDFKEIRNSDARPDAKQGCEKIDLVEIATGWQLLGVIWKTRSA